MDIGDAAGLRLVACHGGGVNPPDDQFDRLTAQVLGADNQPLAGVSVRLEERTLA